MQDYVLANRCKAVQKKQPHDERRIVRKDRTQTDEPLSAARRLQAFYEASCVDSEDGSLRALLCGDDRRASAWTTPLLQLSAIHDRRTAEWPDAARGLDGTALTQRETSHQIDLAKIEEGSRE